MKTKKLPECLVLITDSGVNVTVNKQDLNQSDVAKICDVIMRETGRKAPEIVIQSKF
ncbi:SpoIIIAH-like family protein [Intestinibacillus massiliensis]|nr:SpoIIIAH-like family protein [Intestinibacillus massiliensis]